MSIIDKSNHSSNWLYDNGFARRIKYEFAGVNTTPKVIRLATSANFKLLDRWIKPLEGHFRFEVIVNPDTEVEVGDVVGIIDQPLNMRAFKPTFINSKEVTITGGTILDFDVFNAVDKNNTPTSLPESTSQGRDFVGGGSFYIRVSRESGQDDCSCILEYILAETP